MGCEPQVLLFMHFLCRKRLGMLRYAYWGLGRPSGRLPESAGQGH